MNKINSSYIHTGFSFIIILLIMSCISTFAMLSVITAHSDYKFSKENAQKTTAYYEADAKARDMIEYLDNQFYHMYLSTSSASSFYTEIHTFDFTENVPADICNILLSGTEEETSISYMVPISDIQYLYVNLKINYPHVESECFSTVTNWQIIHNQ